MAPQNEIYPTATTCFKGGLGLSKRSIHPKKKAVLAKSSFSWKNTYSQLNPFCWSCFIIHLLSRNSKNRWLPHNSPWLHFRFFNLLMPENPVLDFMIFVEIMHNHGWKQKTKIYQTQLLLARVQLPESSTHFSCLVILLGVRVMTKSSTIDKFTMLFVDGLVFQYISDI